MALSDLSKASFLNPDLSHARLDEARFSQTDLRGAALAGLDLRRVDLAGAIMTPSQLAYLAEALGIQLME